MDYTKIRIDKIIPSEYNPRRISETELIKLSNTISTFGLVDPIIINLKNNKIIGGHQRYKILSNKYTCNYELNLIRLNDIGWVFDDTDLKIKNQHDEKALNLALNKISGEWQFNKLTNILKGLNEEGFDMSLTGFKNVELDLFDKNKKIEFDQNIFNFKNNKNSHEKITCPQCKHVFEK